jgi:hypothetical protein
VGFENEAKYILFTPPGKAEPPWIGTPAVVSDTIVLRSTKSRDYDFRQLVIFP